jgi:phosphoribosyl 1,2-cyclic phosphodiesterase
MEIKTLSTGSKGNAYIVGDGVTRVLIDAGISLRDIRRGCGYTVSGLAGCLITHDHQDHCKAVKDLMGAGIDCYASKGTFDALKLSGHRAHVVGKLSIFAVGTFRVTAFDVEHDAPEPFGFLLESTATGEKLLYFIDTCYVKYKFDGVHYLMAECNHDAESIRRAIERGDLPAEMLPRLMKSHMSLGTLLKFLKAMDLSKLKQIYLLHMSDRNSSAERMREAVQAETGVEVYVC